MARSGKVGRLLIEGSTGLPSPVARLACSMPLLVGPQIGLLVGVSVGAVGSVDTLGDRTASASAPILYSAHDLKVGGVHASPMLTGGATWAISSVVAGVVNGLVRLKSALKPLFSDEPVKHLRWALVHSRRANVSLRGWLPCGREDAITIPLALQLGLLDDLDKVVARAASARSGAFDAVNFAASGTIDRAGVLWATALGAGPSVGDRGRLVHSDQNSMMGA